MIDMMMIWYGKKKSVNHKSDEKCERSVCLAKEDPGDFGGVKVIRKFRLTYALILRKDS